MVVVSMRRIGADCSVVVMKGVMPVERREWVIAIWLGSTGKGRNPMLNGRR
jgi:hypothetical protein